MKKDNISKAQGHQILSKMGKKVLRPGGKELTLKMMHALNITSNDDIVEFAPGTGYTASLAFKNNPRSYTGVELDEDAAGLLRGAINGHNRKIINCDAANTPLADCHFDKMYGEAMLTMHSEARKSEIVKEAHRILKQGGLYGIHELSLMPDGITEDKKSEIQKDLAQAIRVNARPLTTNEWKALLVKEGFTIKEVFTSPMHLLEPKRMINDEGFFRMLKIVFNIITTPEARKRILEMRKLFRKYSSSIQAIALIAEKN